MPGKRRIAIYDARLAELKEQVAQLEQSKLARETLELLKDRFQRGQGLSRISQLLSCRYLFETKLDLKPQSLGIAAFSHLARHLSKRDIEHLAGDAIAFAEAKALLEQQNDPPSNWYDMYLNWKRLDRRLAFQYFTGKIFPHLQPKHC
jgi:hypothetical protein